MSDNEKIIWSLAGTLVMFKVVTSVMILYYFPSWYAFWILMALSIPWFLPLVYFLPRYLVRRYRLWNVRIRREKLLRQEWYLD